jgi:uncharacterized protein YcaQ
VAAEETMTLSQARRIALASQGFTDRRLGAAGGRVDRRHLHRVLDRVDVVQVDSVNVLVRSQEMPLFSRLGPHRRDLWHQAMSAGEVFEYWDHEASLLPVELWPAMQWRMQPELGTMWPTTRAIYDERPDYVESVYEEVREHGPLQAGALASPGEKRDGMWGRTDGKRALEFLFAMGRITARRHPTTFARIYDTVERSIPEAVRLAPPLSVDDAHRELLDRAGRALGVATDRCLADYHRLNVPRSRPYIRELVEAGRLVPVDVRGWGRVAYRHVDAPRPRRVRARALLSPFDSLVWERQRTEELFGFRYRIEIYVRPHERVHGYYVLPFLLGDRLVARVDLKADRAGAALLVRSAFGEEGIDQPEVAAELAEELELVAGWLGLDRVKIERKGDLATALKKAVAARS